MNAMTFIAQQLEHRRQPEQATRGHGRVEAIRVLLEELGPQSARRLAQELDLPTGRIGALLKHDLKMGRVVFRAGLYELAQDWRPAMQLRPGQELIQWHEADQVLPDADITVLVRTRGCSEPVWLAAWDGEVWRDTEGAEITVIRWADMPQGGDDHG